MSAISKKEGFTMLFRKKIERSCAYCQFGVALDDSTILCSKKGLRKLPDGCMKFRYDATKRIPTKPKALDFSKYDQEDFTL